ncbi:hypothetical protein ABOM_004234 [Aspergillus bombycis]|uniref:Transferase family protein n=1 Tax=Aspergillus bombycis TaxID=109264 RepID=A0A1F8A797_9EURO|nr:hypothetical protein ABOM_004234 [Aspergillus bombycis]OGM47594.1 hypothetical protein ABOM_004234 [Aspergillus bombycis]
MSGFPVTTLATHKVQCADMRSLAQVPCPFPLGPFDHLLPPFATIAVVFVWRKPLGTDTAAGGPIIAFDLLHLALSRLLDFYPHLTGRVRINAKDGSTEIYQLGEGAELHSAVCESPLRQDVVQLAPDDMPGEGKALLAGYSGTPEGFPNEPILSIQHTRFGCGSVSLGVRLNHTVGDAHGFSQLMEDLAEIYRELRTAMRMSSPLEDVQLQQLPCITSYLSDFELGPRESEIALNTKPADYHVEQTPTMMDFKSNKLVTGKLLHFTRGELLALKNAASSCQWVSTFEALSAHLWLSVQRARIHHQNLSKTAVDVCDDTADLLTSLDWRSRTRLNLLPRYFPNAVSEPHITLSLNKLSDDSLPQTAQIIHETLRAKTPADQYETLLWVMAQPNKSNISLRFRFNDKSFIISQWNKLNMYGIHFDTDTQGNCILPDRVWPPFTEASLVDGLAYFLPTKCKASTGIHDSDIEVALSLHDPLWAILENDTHFRKFRE